MALLADIRTTPQEQEQRSMMIIKGLEVSIELQNCRNVWLYPMNSQWILSTRSQEIAYFANERDALEWWKEFETMRGFSVKNPKMCVPQKKTTNTRQAKSNHISSHSRKSVRRIEQRQALLAKINQGRYDNKHDLLILMKNATDKGESKHLNAVQQRLKIVDPKTYQKLVGPLNIRDPLGIKKCYCGHPKSLSEIKDDIVDDNIPEESLLCDACWDQDICSAWGAYGAWGAKIIDTETWRAVCARRGDTKFATY